jgi:SMC interacting uncharacterized protein involved in chromosome segregation
MKRKIVIEVISPTNPQFIESLEETLVEMEEYNKRRDADPFGLSNIERKGITPEEHKKDQQAKYDAALNTMLSKCDALTRSIASRDIFIVKTLNNSFIPIEALRLMVFQVRVYNA